jgi:hypothetical protein
MNMRWLTTTKNKGNWKKKVKAIPTARSTCGYVTSKINKKKFTLQHAMMAW